MGSTLAAVGLTTLFVEGCNGSKNDIEDIIDDDDSVTSFELDEETIIGLSKKLDSGTYSSERLVESYLERFENIDNNGPTLNAIVEINPDAVSIARQMDNERKEGKTRGPLH